MEEQRAAEAVERAERANRFLLLVDSDVNNLYYMSMTLQRLDYRISTAAAAGEAMALADVAAPSLLIIALGPKGMGGPDLIREFKQNRNIADVPIIVVLKQGDLTGEKQCLALGAVECLYLPLSAEKLFRAVQDALEQTPRANIRIRTLLQVNVNNLPLDGRDGVHAVLLSENGMFLPTTKPSPVDTRLSLQIKLSEEYIAAEAIVLYNHHAGGDPYEEAGMGIKFSRIAPGDQKIIRRFIENEISEGIVPLEN